MNNNISTREKPVRLPCPTCGDGLEQKTTRKQKPYFQCEDCGAQVFIRFQKGIERLRFVSNSMLSLKDWAICKDCKVAVRKVYEKVQDPVFGKSGIRCPECDALLAHADEIKR